MTMALLVAALLMGFFGSPHCLGMCGGLVTAFGLSMKDVSPTKRRALVATYHLGRLTSYALLGLVAGLIGVTVLAPLMQGNSMPRILLGLVLVFVGVTMLGAPFLTKLERFGMRFWQYLSPLRQKVFPLNTFPRALTAGLRFGIRRSTDCCRRSQPIKRCRIDVRVRLGNHTDASCNARDSWLVT